MDSPPSLVPASRRFATREWIVLLALVGLHLLAVSVGWTNLNLPGNEFRQSQTAISAHFIQVERNFSPAYPTPVLGKPWSIPMEFPLYQWTVVAVSDWSGLSLTTAARTVSAVCFCLFLPALGLLLRRLGLSPLARLCILGLVLACPIHIFYARAFLIETMALMFGAWYLAALVEAFECRSWPWLVLAIGSGTCAGLAKITTFFVFLVLAAAWAARWLWRSQPTREAGRGPLLRTSGWLVAVHLLPLAVSFRWVNYADSLKRLNPAAEFLTSEAITGVSLGQGRRFEPELWQQHLNLITGGVASPAALLVAVFAFVLGGRRYAGLIGACLASFLLIQLVHPILYAWHDYYYVAIAFLLMTALGLAVAGLIEQPGKVRWAGWVLGGTILALQINLYLNVYYPIQSVRSDGTSGLHLALRDQIDAGDVLLVAGDDWSSILPYYTRHRTLMIREALEQDPPRLLRAFSGLADERVGALLLKGQARRNPRLLEYAVACFGIDPALALTWNDSIDVYFPSARRAALLATIGEKAASTNPRYRELALHPTAAPTPLLTGRVADVADLAPPHRRLFDTFAPRPQRFSAWSTPAVLTDDTGQPRFFAHPDLFLWFALPPGPHRLCTVLALEPGSYENLAPNEATDGVELVATAVFGDGQREELHRRRLTPAQRPEDRRPCPIDWSFTLPAGAELELAVLAGPAEDKRRDWSTLGPLTIE